MTDLLSWLEDIPGPHRGQEIHHAGVSIEDAQSAMIMIHGRGATAHGILDLADLIDQPDLAILAPQAAGSTWYPYSFLESRDLNEPGLSSAHAGIGAIIDHLTSSGIPPAATVLLGFSQGACLVTDYAVRNPGRYGGIIGLSGGLIGDIIDPAAYSGSLDATPVFLGCSDVDPHIPVKRVYDTSEILKGLGAEVMTSIYPGMGHTTNADEVEQARQIIQLIRPK